MTNAEITLRLALAQIQVSEQLAWQQAQAQTGTWAILDQTIMTIINNGTFDAAQAVGELVMSAIEFVQSAIDGTMFLVE